MLSFIVSMFSLVMFSQTYDVTISGVVTDEVTGEFMPFQELTIYVDSSAGSNFVYFNVVVTNDDGYYEDVFQVPVGEEGSVEVSTFSCGTSITQSDYYSDNTNVFTFDFQVCGEPTGNDCEAMYYYYPGNTPLAIQFMDESIGNPTFWDWDFGDGATSNQQNPEHIYSEMGVYSTVLTISSQDSSCSSTFEMMIRVSTDTILPGGCQAMYYYYPGNLENTINFVDESFGNPTSWEWEFGDGSTSTDQNPVHTYATPGEYVVSLFILADSGNCTSFYEDLDFVNNDTIWPRECQAMFFSYPDSVDLLTANFMDMSDTGTPSGIIDTWYWDFGDGNTSTLQNPSHTYAVEGEYNVCLTITTLTGDVLCESTECQITVIGDLSTGCFTWFDFQEIGDLSADFQAYLDGGYYAEYTWDFGDGTTGTGANISHTYAESGIYEVILTAVSQDSTGPCTSSYFEIVWIGEEISFDIDGYVYIQVEGNDTTETTMADYANVYLSIFDTLGTGLINIATTQIDADGYYQFEEVGLQNCIYFVQAELTNNSAYADDYVPTYHLSALNWEEAEPIFPLWYGFGYDVYMISATSSNSGSGTITGTVTEDGSRELLSNIEVLLLDEEGNVIKYVRTNDAGVFVFDDLAMGTYIVYTEIVGIETIPFDVTLNDENNTSEVNVIVKNGQALLGIYDLNSAYIKSVEDIYPNPVTADAALNITIKETANIKVEVLNQYGQSLFTNEVTLTTGEHKVNIPSHSYAQGMYFVRITANDNISSVRKFIKLR